MINFIIGGIFTGIILFILFLIIYLLLKINNLSFIINNLIEDVIYLNNQNIELKDKYNNLTKPRYETRLYEEFNNSREDIKNEY